MNGKKKRIYRPFHFHFLSPTLSLSVCLVSTKVVSQKTVSSNDFSGSSVCIVCL